MVSAYEAHIEAAAVARGNETGWRDMASKEPDEAKRAKYLVEADQASKRAEWYAERAGWYAK